MHVCMLGVCACVLWLVGGVGWWVGGLYVCMDACMHACMHVGKHAMHACIVWWVISRSGAALHLIFAAFLQQVIGWSSVEGTGFQKALAEKVLKIN